MLDATPAIAPRSGVLAWLIGFFALWQLAFIPLSNAIEFVPLRPSRHDTNPPIETAQRWGRFTRIDALQWSAEGVADVLAFWGEATGQDQGWVMFTPGFPPHTVVLAADFHFADGTRDRSYSRFLPADLSRPAAALARHPRPRIQLRGQHLYVGLGLRLGFTGEEPGSLETAPRAAFARTSTSSPRGFAGKPTSTERFIRKSPSRSKSC